MRASPAAPRGWIVVAMILVLLVALVATLLVLSGDEGAELVSGYLVVAWVALFVGLLAVLGLLAAVLAWAGLSSHPHSLALPSGSVRAMLALGLLVVFAGMSMTLYRALSQPPAYQELSLRNVSESEMAKLPVHHVLEKGEPVGTDAEGEEIFDARVLLTGRNPAAEDLAKQIFTTLATVLVTVVGFYFGSRAATTAAGTAPSETPPEGPSEEEIGALGRNLEQRARAEAAKKKTELEDEMRRRSAEVEEGAVAQARRRKAEG